MSYLPDHYRATNIENGHDYNCGWGAGTDCSCRVRDRAIAERRAECRIVYRVRQERSGLDPWAFRALVLDLDWLVPLDVDSEEDVIEELTAAAKIVSACHWLAGRVGYCYESATPADVLSWLVEDARDERGRAVPTRWDLARMAEERVEARIEREENWRH